MNQQTRNKLCNVVRQYRSLFEESIAPNPRPLTPTTSCP
jgi:hypothetical protein